jgi:hypothetical protein
MQRHALTGRGIESDADPTECFTHVRDQAQMIAKVTVGRRQWPTLVTPYRPREEGKSYDDHGTTRA